MVRRGVDGRRLVLWLRLLLSALALDERECALPEATPVALTGADRNASAVAVHSGALLTSAGGHIARPATARDSGCLPLATKEATKDTGMALRLATGAMATEVFVVGAAQRQTGQ